MTIHKQRLLFLLICHVAVLEADHVYSALIRLPTATISRIEHQPVKQSEQFPSFYGMVDYVAINANGSGTGDVSLATFSGSWESGDEIVFRWVARSGHQFRITPHPNTEYTNFHSQMNFFENGKGGSQFETTAAIRLENSQGMLPAANFLDGIVGQAGGNIGYTFDYYITESITFSAIEVTYIAGGPGQIPSGTENRIFFIETSAGGLGPLADQILFELVPIPEPAAWSILMSSLLFNMRFMRKQRK
jgi:hypothetical protein